MPALTALPPRSSRDRHDLVELEDAREALAYWERREQRLPRRAVKARREAREMAGRWRARVDEAERAEYGRGLLGALLVLAGERRLPVRTRHAGRQLARRSRQVLAVVVAALVTMAVAGVVIAVELLAHLLRAFGG